MIKKRTRPQPRQRESSTEIAEEEYNYSNAERHDITVDDLLAYRKFRKSKQGIDVGTLNKGELGSRKKHRKEKQVSIVENTRKNEVENNVGNEGDKAKSMIKSNNFTQQTNALDVDKHMMAYIEEKLKFHRGDPNHTELTQDESQDDLLSVPSKYKVENSFIANDEGSVTNSLAMLTAIPEVDLGMDTRLRNIEETEKAKRAVAEDRKERNVKKTNDEEHLIAARFYNPSLRQKSDLDIIRDAKLEAMGLPLRREEHEHRPYYDRNLMATDELVMERFKKRIKK